MIMAAGLGTRMQPFSDIFPKALMPVFGSPILQYTIDLFRFDGMETVVINGHHKGEMVKKAIPTLDRGSLKVHYSDETKRLLGSAGGMVKALPFFKGKPFFRVNADRLVDFDFQALAAKHFELRQRHGVLMTLALAKSTSGRYPEIAIDSKKELVRGVGPSAQEKPFFTGVAIMECEAFSGLSDQEPTDFVNAVLNPALKQNKVGYQLVDFDWIDIDSPEQLYRCHLSMMDRYELGTLPRGWMFRMYEKNQRLAEGLWVSNATQIEKAPTWKKRVYYFGSHAPSIALGPDLVCYGQPQGDYDTSKGIRLQKEWQEFKTS